MYRRDFKYNHTTSLYDIAEKEITYSMPLELTRKLKQTANPSIKDWFNSELSTEEKKKIRVSGANPTIRKSDDFFSDPTYED